MNIRELTERLTNTVDSLQEHQDPTVMIVLNEPGVGARPMTEVTSAYLGFDWEAGRLILKTKDPVKRAKEP